MPKRFKNHVSCVEIKKAVGSALTTIIDEDELEGLSFKEKRKKVALAMLANGNSQADVGKQLGYNQATISRIMKQELLDEKQGRGILRRQLLTNASHANVIFSEKAETLTATQAAMAAGIFTKSYIAVDTSAPKEEDSMSIEEIIAIGEDIKELKDIILDDQTRHGNIEIQAVADGEESRTVDI